MIGRGLGYPCRGCVFSFSNWALLGSQHLQRGLSPTAFVKLSYDVSGSLVSAGEGIGLGSEVLLLDLRSTGPSGC